MTIPFCNVCLEYLFRHTLQMVVSLYSKGSYFEYKDTTIYELRFLKRYVLLDMTRPFCTVCLKSLFKMSVLFYKIVSSKIKILKLYE